MDEAGPPHIRRRSIARAAVQDVSLGVSVIPIWALVFGAGELSVLVTLAVIRSVVVYQRMWSELGPLADWLERSSSTAPIPDQELLAMDASLQRGPIIYGGVAALSWVAVFVLATVMAMIGLPTSLPIHGAELLNAAIMLLAVICGTASMTPALLEPALLEARAELATELRQRKLERERERTQLALSNGLLNVGCVLAVFFGLSSLGAMLAIHGWRDASVAEQGLVAAHAAADFDRSGELGEGARLVSAAGLPEVLDLQAGVLAALDFEADVSVAAAPTRDGRYVVTAAELDEHLLSILAFVLVAPFLCGAPMFLANVTGTRALTRQLEEIDAATKRVLEAGEIRGIARFDAPRNDEVGALIHDFNGLLDVLEELADAAQHVADGNLAVKLDRPGDLHGAFRGMLTRLRDIVLQIRGTALGLKTAASELEALTHEQEVAAEHQSRTVTEVSAAVELLATAALDIEQAAAAVLDNAEQTQSTTKTMASRISELGVATRNIGELLERIREIADRSDLLALNGALEATRAGDAGRGFALVAAEMRRLAEQVTGLLVDVRRRVDEIERAGASTVVATKASLDLAERTAAAAREISTLTVSQGDDTQRASEGMLQVAQNVIATATAMSQTRAAAQGLEHQADELEQLTTQFEV